MQRLDHEVTAKGASVMKAEMLTGSGRQEYKRAGNFFDSILLLFMPLTSTFPLEVLRQPAGALVLVAEAAFLASVSLYCYRVDRNERVILEGAVLKKIDRLGNVIAVIDLTRASPSIRHCRAFDIWETGVGFDKCWVTVEYLEHREQLLEKIEELTGRSLAVPHSRMADAFLQSEAAKQRPWANAVEFRLKPLAAGIVSFYWVSLIAIFVFATLALVLCEGASDFWWIWKMASALVLGMVLVWTSNRGRRVIIGSSAIAFRRWLTGRWTVFSFENLELYRTRKYRSHYILQGRKKWSIEGLEDRDKLAALLEERCGRPFCLEPDVDW